MNKKSIALLWLILTPRIGFGMGAENMSIHTLIYAINQGNKGLVGEILKHHPELSNACDTEGNRPLHVAAQAYSEAHIDHEPVYSDDECGDAQKRSDDKRGKQEEIMGLLLEHGAKPNGCNARGNTPVDILTQGAPFMMCVGTTNFRATTPAHLLLYEWRGKSSKELEEQRKALRRGREAGKCKRNRR